MINNNWATEPWCQYAWCVPTGDNALHTQVKMVRRGVATAHIQVRLVAYSDATFRILWEFKSDGITANNFTASSEASADKGVLNLKSDIIEKYWQTTACAAEWARFDAGSGRTISLDTFALIGHNLTSSAVVTLKGSGDGSSSEPGDWSVVPVYATLAISDDPDESNLIWVSHLSPAAAYRWWRLDIDDHNNPDGFIRAGRLVAGSALVFNGENCLDEVSVQEQSFKDELELNGFTRISNNRALKKTMRITFKDLNRLGQANYRGLKRYIRYCRDTLKALVIVDPSDEQSKYEFAVFAKLKEMPTEAHRYIDSETSYTALELDLDEGK